MHAYDPIREPREEISQDHMRETLARRVRESIQKHAERVKVHGGSGEPTLTSKAAAVPDGAKPSPTPAAISWDKPIRTSEDGLGFQRSTNGKYVIAKVRVGPGPDFRYTVSRCHIEQPAEVRMPAQVLGSFSNPAEAKACCEGAK